MSEGLTSYAAELTVLIAEDHLPSRAGITSAIKPYGLRVVAEADDAAEAAHLALLTQPDISVVAVALPGNGIEAARMVRQAAPATTIVMMTESCGRTTCSLPSERARMDTCR